MNTITKITKVSMDDVASAYIAESNRIKVAAQDMSERYYRRHSDGINYLDDMEHIATPPAPEMPADLKAVIGPHTHGLQYVTPKATADQICMHGLTRTYQGRDYFDLVTATPKQYLLGLRAITRLADQWEDLARQYRASVIAANEKHIAAQYDAAKELASVIMAAKH